MMTRIGKGSIRNVIKEIACILPRKTIYYDVGAHGGIADPWKSFHDLVKLVCFEPDEEEYKLLTKNKTENTTVYKYALYKEARNISFNLTKSRTCSSLYKPNHDLLRNYLNVENFLIDEVVTIEATSLDELYKRGELSNIDFIKIDVQGAGLDVLQGGKTFLSENILGIQIEVEFDQIYENQALFSETDQFIRRSLGLHIQDLEKVYWKYKDGINVGPIKGKLIFGDALYFRPPHDIMSWCSRLSKRDAINKVLIACLMGIVYGYLDYSLCLLSQPEINSLIPCLPVGHA